MVSPLVYFDSCIWIAMIKAEQRDELDPAILPNLAEALDEEKIKVLSSALIIAECLECNFDDKQNEIFTDIFNNQEKVRLPDPDRNIMELSAEIRSFYKAKGIKAPATPDAIHLATAIYYNCDEFFTLDKNNKADGSGLLNLETPIADKYNLKICLPHN
ncbi:MAG: type II toxin-antitoxin system VapC family toxin [Alphaproteobacteria bacterium]|nr:type II toxin-antitoxin system VapC family toxin [Alphaproteobacteria bacterium]